MCRAGYKTTSSELAQGMAFCRAPKIRSASRAAAPAISRAALISARRRFPGAFRWAAIPSTHRSKCLIFRGALGEIRTPDPRNRNPMLYPAELRAHWQRRTAPALSQVGLAHDRHAEVFAFGSEFFNTR